jgi:hypothetical protein
VAKAITSTNGLLWQFFAPAEMKPDVNTLVYDCAEQIDKSRTPRAVTRLGHCNNTAALSSQSAFNVVCHSTMLKHKRNKANLETRRKIIPL